METRRRSKRLQQLTETSSPARRSTSTSTPPTAPALHPETAIAGSTRPSSPTAPQCYFSNLSPELLIKIWRLTFPIDRIIEVKFPRNSQSLSHRFVSREHPVALRLCRHSRIEALKRYVLFSTLGSSNKIYLDSENDMLHFREDGFTDPSNAQVQAFINHLSIANKQRIRNLSIRSHLLCPTTTYPPMVMFFPNLKCVRVNFRISKDNTVNPTFTTGGLEHCNCDNMEQRPAKHSIFLSDDNLLHHWKHHRYAFGIGTIPSRILKEVTVPEFMRGVKQNQWGIFFQWLEPKWEFGAVLSDHMSMKNFYCESSFVALTTVDNIKAQWAAEKMIYNDGLVMSGSGWDF